MISIIYHNKHATQQRARGNIQNECKNIDFVLVFDSSIFSVKFTSQRCDFYLVRLEKASVERQQNYEIEGLIFDKYFWIMRKKRKNLYLICGFIIMDMKYAKKSLFILHQSSQTILDADLCQNFGILQGVINCKG